MQKGKRRVARPCHQDGVGDPETTVSGRAGAQPWVVRFPSEDVGEESRDERRFERGKDIGGTLRH